MRGNPVRKTILYGAAGAILCAAGLLVWVLAESADRADWGIDGSGRLLWALRSEASDGVETKAMGVLSLSAAGSCALSIPSDLSVKGPDGRLVELSDLAESRGWKTCCEAVSDVLGVPVTAYVVLRWDDAVAICDALAPISIDVPAPVTCRAGTSDAELVTIAQGRQVLTGRDLLAVVVGASDDEMGADRQARALRALAGASLGATLPAGTLSGVRSNLPAGDLLKVWEALGGARDVMVTHEVPTSLIVRDGVARRVVLAVEMNVLVASAVRAKPLLTPRAISVAVFNGCGARLAATKAAQYLEVRGFRIMAVGNADTSTYTATTILRLTDEAKAWMLRDTLPGTAKIATEAEFGARYEALRAKIPRGTDLVLVVGAGMEWSG